MADENQLPEQEDTEPRERAFVQAFVWGPDSGVGNLCAAAAGYRGDAKTLSQRAWLLRQRPRVAEAIARETAEKEKLVKGQFLRVAEELFGMATVDLTEAFNPEGGLLKPGEMPVALRRALQSVETDELFDGVGKDRMQVGVTRKVKVHDKIAAATKFLQFADKLTEKTKVELGQSLADLVLGAQRKREGKTPEPPKENP